MTSEPQSAAQGRSAWQKIAALLAGPVLLITIGFILFGEWGAIAGIFIGLAALVFIPAFGAMLRLSGVRSLPGVVILANLVPLAFWAINCPLSGNACPNYSAAAAAPQFVAATICAVLYWALALRR